jgi:hypothetical protein
MSADLALRPIRLRLARGLLLDALPAVLRRRVAASPVAPWELLNQRFNDCTALLALGEMGLGLGVPGRAS